MTLRAGAKSCHPGKNWDFLPQSQRRRRIIVYLGNMSSAAEGDSLWRRISMKMQFSEFPPSEYWSVRASGWLHMLAYPMKITAADPVWSTEDSSHLFAKSSLPTRWLNFLEATTTQTLMANSPPSTVSTSHHSLVDSRETRWASDCHYSNCERIVVGEIILIIPWAGHFIWTLSHSLQLD